MTQLEDSSIRALRELRRDAGVVAGQRTRDIIDNVRSRLFGGSAAERAPARMLGRYKLGELISYGGMGVVQRAHDPLIGRDVAIKFCVPGGDPRNHQRLLNEAWALGSLRHENIIAVYDAGVSQNQQFYIVLELITGETLTRWLVRNHSWRQIVEVFIAAGDGLAAAHAHEPPLLHRDFKPSNVLIDAHGKVKLIDFGLVKALNDASAAQGAGVAATPLGPTMPSEDGLILGTRGFLAPELFDGEAPTRASDLFSYCVALYWALYRRYPFIRPLPQRDSAQPTPRSGRVDASRPPGAVDVATTPVSGPLSAQSIFGQYIPPNARERGVPRAIAEILRRGLALDPNQRHASMDKLLAELRQVTAQRRRITALTVAGLLLVGGGSAYAGAVSATPEPCPESPLQERWQDSRESVRASASALNPDAPGAADSVERVLAGYANTWDAANKRQCEAERREPRLSAATAARSACLDHRRRRFLAALDGPQHLDAQGVPVVASDLALPSVADCENPRVLASVCRTQLTLPDQPDATFSIDATLASAQAAALAGDFTVATKLGVRAAQTADEARLPGLQARAHFALGAVLYHAGRFAEAQPELELAHRVASTGGCNDMNADALSLLNRIAAREGRIDPELTADRLQMQWIAADQLGEDNERLADSYNDQGLWLNSRGRFADALAPLAAAIRLREARRGKPSAATPLAPSERRPNDEPRTARPGDLSAAGLLALSESYLNRSNALVRTGRPHEDDLHRSQERRLEAVGEHPSTYKTMLSRGNRHFEDGRYDEAEADYRLALRFAQRYDWRSLDAAHVMQAVGRVRQARGAIRTAAGLLEDAHAIAAERAEDGVLAFNLDMAIPYTLQSSGDADDSGAAEAHLLAALQRYRARPERIAEIHARLSALYDASFADPALASAHASKAIDAYELAGITVAPYLAIARQTLARALGSLIAEEPNPSSLSREQAELASNAMYEAIGAWLRQPHEPLATDSLAAAHLDLALLRCEALHDADGGRRHLELARRYAGVAGTSKDYAKEFDSLNQEIKDHGCRPHDARH